MRCESFEAWEEIGPGGGAAAKTVVLIGKTGNGKSATGNSIIGRQVFESMPTSSCKLATTVLSNGQILNVIDTPGLFDSAVEPRERDKEIAKCISMAKDGIDAVLLVMSLRSLRWEEEVSAFESLCQIFGGRIADYVVLVFAHGDHRLNDPESIDHFCRNFPQLCKTSLRMCKNRVVAFDNKTEDEAKISSQRKKLLSLVDDVVERNGGEPYTNDQLDELMKGEMNPIDQSSEGEFHVSREEEFNQFIDMVESSLKESTLEKQLDEERAARMEAQVKACVLQTKSKDEAESRLKESIHNLEKQLAEERDARMEAEMKVLSVQTKSKDNVIELKECLKQLAEERAAHMEAEMKALALQTKSKAKVLELKNCLDRVEKSRMQLEEKLHRVEKKMAEERAARMEAEMKMLSLQTKSKDEVLEMEQCLKGAEESRNHLEERLHGVESIRSLEKQLADERAARIDAEMRSLALQTKSKDEVLELKDCFNRVEESRKHLEERLHIVESISNLEKQMAEERASRMEAEMKVLSLQTKSKDDVFELKECLNRAEKSRKQLEERLHRVESIHNLEKQLAKERAARMEAEMKALSLQTKPKHDVLELKACLNRAEESSKQLEERLHRVEKLLTEDRAAQMEAEMKAPELQTRSKDEVLKEGLKRVEGSRMQLEERLHKIESIHNLQKLLADERLTQMEAEMESLSHQIKSKGDVLELKECLNKAEESRKQLEERLLRAEKQLAEERTACKVAEMNAPELQTRSKNDILELKERLNRAEESRMQLEERLHKVESTHNLQKQLADERVTQMEAETMALSLQIKSKDDLLKLKECLKRSEESLKQFEERLYSVTGTDNTTKTSRKENAVQDTTHYLPEGELEDCFGQ